MWAKLWDAIVLNPVISVKIVECVIALLVAFYVPLTAQQKEAIYALTIASLSIAFVVRSKVTPVDSPKLTETQVQKLVVIPEPPKVPGEKV